MSDDCGDGSDEALALCEGREDEPYFRETFEEEVHLFFNNDPNNEGSSWLWGTGNELLKGRSPAFDHTLLNDRGHYMRLDINGNKFASAELISQLLEPPLNPEDECRIRFYYHFVKEESDFQDFRFIIATR